MNLEQPAALTCLLSYIQYLPFWSGSVCVVSGEDIFYTLNVLSQSQIILQLIKDQISDALPGFPAHRSRNSPLTVFVGGIFLHEIFLFN